MGITVAWQQARLNTSAFHAPDKFPSLEKALEIIDPPPPQTLEELEMILKQVAVMAGMKETYEPIEN